MLPAATRVPDVLDALYTALREPLEADRWQVFDGPIAAQSVEFEGIIVGDARDLEDMAVESETERATGLGVGRYREGYEIRCSMWSMSGDDGMKARRDRVRDGLAIVEAVLKSDPSLDGAVDLASMGGTQQWRQIQTDSGPVVEVWFSVLAVVER